MQPPARQLDHGVVEVERGHVVGLEPVQEDFGADPSPAADLEHLLAGEVTARKAAKPRRFPVVLMGSPNRVVHRGTFDAVELHPVTPLLIVFYRCHR